MVDAVTDARHSNAVRWDLRYPPGVTFGEEHVPSAEQARIPVHRYTSAEFLQRELAGVWDAAWQMACRVEDVPRAGDFVECPVGRRTVLVVRSSTGELRAFYDTCRHRGNLLKAGRGSATELRCNFHQWCWHLDGSLKEIPDRHLFPPLADEDYALSQLACATWAGFVFVHPDPHPEQSLEEFLGPVADQLAAYPLELMRATLEATMPIACNWKVAVEAFLEVYHVGSIHPQLMTVMDDVNTAYELLGAHSRMIVPYGVPSMRLDDVDPLETYDDFLAVSQDTGFKDKDASASRAEAPRRRPPELFDSDGRMMPGTSVREHLIERVRRRVDGLGHGPSRLDDGQLIDDWHYYIFPGMVLNLHGPGFLLFRIRPHAVDPGRCWFDVYTFRLPRADAEAVEPRRPNVDDPDVSFGQILDQDFRNLPGVQRGLEGGVLEHITVSGQEIRIVALHDTVDRFIEAEGVRRAATAPVRLASRR